MMSKRALELIALIRGNGFVRMRAAMFGRMFSPFNVVCIVMATGLAFLPIILNHDAVSAASKLVPGTTALYLIVTFLGVIPAVMVCE